MRGKRICLWISFIAYILLMLWLLFGQRIDGWRSEYSVESLMARINIIPFRTLTQQLMRLSSSAKVHAFINLFGNIIMFVPLGFFIPTLFSKTNTLCRTVLWSLVTVIGIELIQLFTLLGSLDVDDVILNLLGVVIGFGVYREFRQTQRREE